MRNLIHKTIVASLATAALGLSLAGSISPASADGLSGAGTYTHFAPGTNPIGAGMNTPAASPAQAATPTLGGNPPNPLSPDDTVGSIYDQGQVVVYPNGKLACDPHVVRCSPAAGAQ